jgi:hypothetical protein
MLGGFADSRGAVIPRTSTDSLSGSCDSLMSIVDNRQVTIDVALENRIPDG